MNGIGSSKVINHTAQLAAQFNEFYLEITSPKISQIGNYKIIKEIGEGAFGKAYLATHVLLNINVVLKCGLIDDPNIVREIYYHKQLKHKNIVSLYEVIKTENHLWIALEYCQGGELYYYIYEKKRLELDECRNIFFQIVLGVKYVHSLNLSHRDLKLENILLADQKRTIVKLTDFGFIREFNPQSRKFLSTICGTTVYMAPELLTGQKYSGFAIDIWSMGVILYTMLNGMLPFDDDDEMKIQHKVINTDPMFYDHVPVDANQLISKMLSKDPNQRPSLNEILNSSFLIDLYNKYLEKGNKRNSSGSGDAESIISINQHYNTVDRPFEAKIEKDLLRKLQRIDFDTEELKATMYNNEINSLTAFYELLLTQEYSKKKQKYIREKKRKLYEAKKSIKKSRKRVKSALSLSDQASNSQPLERIMSSLSITSNKNSSSRHTSFIARKSLDKADTSQIPPSPKSSQGSRLNIEIPSPRATNTSIALPPRSRRSSREISTTTAASSITADLTTPLRRTVSFVPDGRRLSQVISEPKEANKKTNKSGKILHKLQFWKKNKGDEYQDDTISHYSTKSNHSKSTNDVMMESDGENPLEIIVKGGGNKNNNSPIKLDNTMHTVAPEVLDQQRLASRFQKNDGTQKQRENQNLEGQSGKLERPQQVQSQHHRQQQLQSSNTGLSINAIDSPHTPPSAETSRFARTRPSSMISQISQFSKLSQMSTMLSESELDILDETDTMDDDDDDDDYDDEVYESSINTSQDNKISGSNAPPSSSNQGGMKTSNKKRPTYRRGVASDTSITSTPSASGGGGSGIISTIPKKKNSLSKLRSNSSEDISEDSYRFNDENIPLGRSGSPDLGKKRSFRALQQPVPLINGTIATSISEKLNDATKMPYVRAPSPPVGFKYNAKANKKMMTTAVNGNNNNNNNNYHQPPGYQDTKQVEDWIHNGTTGNTNTFTKSTIYQPVINEEEEENV
ncbi:serine/threonine-protein kinase, putative [Candida dubliniensis CD36]|uniref:non-specific serine/threonine protein kinase n=1 Tax=Candida dubliniensis (strain CD36 / ATCC MYA-646 / CBS 7987 / NCPF 3949 / NRRL Y-17841) TaxID=573826 RepID=B9WBB1_CANDC|nr:serine/threonine-protein kinase, putative [Candida dubliniensis CD36]CAX43681.1 serine/threonine-protein kinase, putative [Candida dubliniensis CD36]